jgi:hypothetical protein
MFMCRGILLWYRIGVFDLQLNREESQGYCLFITSMLFEVRRRFIFRRRCDHIHNFPPATTTKSSQQLERLYEEQSKYAQESTSASVVDSTGGSRRLKDTLPHPWASFEAHDASLSRTARSFPSQVFLNWYTTSWYGPCRRLQRHGASA